MQAYITRLAAICDDSGFLERARLGWKSQGRVGIDVEISPCCAVLRALSHKRTLGDIMLCGFAGLAKNSRVLSAMCCVRVGYGLPDRHS